MDTVIIKTIPHEEQRYRTAGDWITEEEGQPKGTVEIRVSEMEDERLEFLLGLHEFIEWFFAKQHGVKGSDVTLFDTWWEEQADSSQKEDEDILEPGDHPMCPVYHEHRFALVIERAAAHELNVDWRLYERELRKLDTPSTQPPDQGQ